MLGFRETVLASGSQLGWSAKRGSAPTPFDAVDGARLAGPQGSHPLAAISMDELVDPASDGLDGAITIENASAIRIGDGITGRIAVTARRDIKARGAVIRLVGGMLAERNESDEDRDSEGKVIRSEHWVEVNGRLFEQLPFTDTPLPPTLSAGQHFEAQFTLPAPRLGPVSGHLGSAIVAWAIEARWDVPMGGDQRLATLVAVRQNLDYLRSGAVRLEPGAMFDAWSDGDGTIAVRPLPPIAAGQEIDVTVTWPSAGSGRGGRFELHANVDAPNGMDGVVLYSAAVDPAAFRGGSTFRVMIPPDAPPTMAYEGVGVNYRLRALVDRPFRSDLAIERALAVV